MSFFSKILKGLGFEEDEEKPTKPEKQPKEKVKNKKLKPNFATFDLNQEDDLSVKQETKIEENKEEIVKEEQPIKTASFDIIKVTNQVEVQNVVNKLKNGEQVIINMLALSEVDLTRSLDFLTGAVYALDKSMQKVDDAIYIIQ